METSIDPTTQELVDHHELTTLVSRLGAVLDEARFDEMPSLLLDDVTARTPGGTAAGREHVVEQARRNHQPDLHIQHLITNVLVDLDGDRARLRANLVVHFAPPPADGDGALAPPVAFTLGEVYRFQASRTTDGWRFAHIETVPMWSAGTPLR